MNTPWCIIGDFNDILAANEKIGVHDRPSWMINGFRDAVFDCDLVDIPLRGHPFMWFKSLGTERAVEVRLDRAMANGGWLSIFSEATLSNVVASVFDHSPIVLHTEEVIAPRRRVPKFRFENAWLYEEDIERVVTGGWRRIQEDSVQSKLGGCVEELASWSRQLRSKFKDKIDACKRRIKEL